MNAQTFAALTALTAVTTLAGCSGDPRSSADGESNEGELATRTAEVPTFAENMARLQALHIFEVAPLADMINESASCYRSQTAIGMVCVEEMEDRADEIAAAEKRVADFTDRVEKAVKDPAGHGFLNVDPGDLDALRKLHVVEVGEFIVDQPESYACYGFCNSSNQNRASQLHHIAAAITND